MIALVDAILDRDSADPHITQYIFKAISQTKGFLYTRELILGAESARVTKWPT